MSWLPVSRREMPAVVQFLLPHEALHVPFTSRLRTGARGCEVYCRRDAEGALRESVLFTSSGLLLPVLSPEEGTRERCADGRGDLSNLMRDHRPAVHSIMGIGRCVRDAEALLPVEPTTRIDYFLMTVDRTGLRPGMLRDASGLHDSRGVRVRKAGPSDAEQLFPMQKGYELEEVVIDPIHFSDSACMRLLKLALKEELVYVAEIDGRPVAKASTNARGFGVDQVGGVYTLPELRDKGIGAVVVTALLKAVLAEKTAACLFVKKRNRPAIALYDRLGFQPVTDYVISYYGM